MPDAARHKLQEAQFFLQQLIREKLLTVGVRQTTRTATQQFF
jgi:hypothetical protein